MTRYVVHTIDTGGIDMAARPLGRRRGTAPQIFTAIPKYYGDKSSIRPERVARFRAALEATGIAPQSRHRARRVRPQHRDVGPGQVGPGGRGLAKELERSTALGIGGICFHPGAATDGDRAERRSE